MFSSCSKDKTTAPVKTDTVATANTLINLNLSLNAYSNYTTYFVLTDESGNILNEVKYVQGVTTLKIPSLTAYKKDRFNFFEIKISKSSDTAPGIEGFLQVKKGSTYTSNLPSEGTDPITIVKMRLSSTASFDRLNVSGDYAGTTINSVADSSQLQYILHSSTGKIFVQELKNNQSMYNFFDIPAGATDYNIDLAQLTKTSSKQTITSPGTNLEVEVFAKTKLNYQMNYNFGLTSTSEGQLDYYYPSESFPEYDALMFYRMNGFDYAVVNAGTTIPSSASAFDASFTTTGSSLADFVPTISGTSDFYHATFLNATPGQVISVDLYSPTVANYTLIKLPDFSKYLGLTSLDLSLLKLQYFGLYQASGFNEAILTYKDYHSYFDVNSKAVVKNY